MKDYYEILGVSEDAGKGDIKKAYFSLVRKYPPEREPERFKEYRKAYEVLSDEQSRKEYDRVKHIPEECREVIAQAEDAILYGDFEGAIGDYKWISERFPNILIIKAMLGEAYLLNGNSGNAVKIFEELVKCAPETMAYQKTLGQAYAQRGFHKKALRQYELSQKLEPDNLDYYGLIADLHVELERYDLAKKTLAEGFDLAKAKGFDDTALLISGVLLCLDRADVIELEAYLEQLASKMALDTSVKETIGMRLISRIAESTPDPEGAAGYHCVARFLLEQMPDNETIQELSRRMSHYQILAQLEQDERISQEIFDLTEVLLRNCNCPACQGDQLALELTILENIAALRGALRHLRECYPEVYALHDTFYQNVMNPKKERWLYETLYKKFKKNQQYMPAFTQEYVGDWEDEEYGMPIVQPYVRDTPKVGRNDPCPCGSGKKYKKCCGAN